MENLIVFIKEHKVAILVFLLIIAIGVSCISIGYIIGSSGKKDTSAETTEVVSTPITESDATDSFTDSIDSASDNENKKRFDEYEYDLGKDYEADLDYNVITEKDPLNIRKEPYKDAKKIGKVPRGECVYVEDTENHWGYIQYEGNKGWIDLNYCFATHGHTVWVTLDGLAECYHNPWCRTIQDYNPVQVSLSYALDSLHRRPCKVCYGKVNNLFEDIFGFDLEELAEYD